MEKENRGCGIICEYNPFHLGHKYQLEKALELYDFTVCVMSGDFVQRGEAAFQKKEIRAKNACASGADIVLELPFPYSSFSAEGFAYKGIEVLTKSGLCSAVMFGSECGDVKVLTDIATLLSKDEFYLKVLTEQKNQGNLSFARARSLVVEKEMGADYAHILDNPNDILGAEYIKAIIKQQSPLVPVPLKRSTPRGGFDENFASSSFIRKTLFDEENGEFAKSRLPEDYDFSGIRENTDDFYRLILVSLAMKKPQELEKILEVPKGAGYKIVDSARRAKNFDELCGMICGKTYTFSKVKRMLLFAFFDITKDVYFEKAEFTQVLALSENGAAKLKKYREFSEIVIASRVKDIKQNGRALRCYNRSRLASEVLEKCLEK